MECHIHKVPMDWIEDVLAYLDKWGCLYDPCEQVSMMAPSFTSGDKLLGTAAH